MALSDILAARREAAGSIASVVVPESSDGRWTPGAPGPSRDFKRVMLLPRRQPPVPADFTPLFARPGGQLTLRPIQNLAILEAVNAGGLVALIGVGHGKTLLSLLLPRAMDAKRPLLLVPAQVRGQLLSKDIPYLSQHFFLHPNLTILSYEELSSAKNTGELDRLKPDLIIADEAHKLRHRDAARTKRFLRFFKSNDCRFCALSGTLAGRSIEDYAHLAGLALGEGSPLPLDRWEARNWAAALDVKAREPVGPGVLTALGTPLLDGFRRRLLETEGVVATAEASINADLAFEAWDYRAGPAMSAALAALEESWTTPGGEELEDVLALHRAGRQIAQGFYYRWVWGPKGPDVEWLQARAAWHRAVREFLNGPHAGAGMDSPLLLAMAAKRGEASKKVQQAWPAWDAVRHRDPPPVEAVWQDDSMIRAAVAWAKENTGIVWYEHDAVGQALAKAGLPVFGPGPEAGAALIKERGNRSVAASILAHGTGKNLQSFHTNLFLCPPSGGAVWEQAVGRTHRQGQKAKLIRVVVARHAGVLRKAWTSAMMEADFVATTTGATQRLLFGTKDFDDDREEA